MVFLAVANLVIANLYICTIVSIYHKLQDTSKTAPGMNNNQMQVVDALRLMIATRPIARPMPPPKSVNCFAQRQLAYDIVLWDFSGTHTGAGFELITAALIVFNIALGTLYVYTGPADGEVRLLFSRPPANPSSSPHPPPPLPPS